MDLETQEAAAEIKAFVAERNAMLSAAAVRLATPSSGEFERGWNAALAAAQNALATYADRYYGKQTIGELCEPIAALRKPAQEEVK